MIDNLTTRMELEALNATRATLEAVADTEPKRTLTIPRDLWEQMERPAVLYVTVATTPNGEA